MPAKKSKKTVKKSSVNEQTNRIGAAAGILFAGAAVALLGTIQEQDNIKLLLIGFAAALLVLGGVVLGMATQSVKKK